MKYRVTVKYENLLAKYGEKSKEIFTITTIGEVGLKRIKQKYDGRKNYKIERIAKSV